MSTARWLLDSNAVMGYLNGDLAPGFAEAIERCLGEGAAVSVITLIEVLGWRGHFAQNRTDAERLLRGLTLVGLSPPVVERTIGLRSQPAIKLPDAVIAASALVEGLCLVTRNGQDFALVQGLAVMNPYAADQRACSGCPS